MVRIQVKVHASKVEVSAENSKGVVIEFLADDNELLSHFSVADIVAHFDVDDLLSEIGEDAAREYFDIE